MTQAFDDVQTLDAVAGDQIAAHSPHALFARRDRPEEWLARAVEELRALAQLDADWDSYGARAIDKAVIEHAVAYLSELAYWVGVPKPHIGASPAGHVGLSWDEGAWSLDAGIDGTGLIRYGYLDEQDAGRERESRTRDITQLVPYLAQWDRAR